MKKLSILLIYIALISPNIKAQTPINDGVSLIVLGNTQDAGSPHLACEKDCCKDLFENPPSDRKVVSLGLVDFSNKQTYLFDASPDFTSQTRALKNFANADSDIPAGIFLTHAHIGHYTGLMYLGKEGYDSDGVKVYTLPKMNDFLENNGPWDELVNNENIELVLLHNKKEIDLNPNISVSAIKVPHRDEYSETVAYVIQGPKRRALFIPDIDKWEEWDENIVELIKEMDFVFIDATFYDAAEINNRDISEIPHPFVIESMELFKDLEAKDKMKVHFIHFNHTNPLLDPNSEQTMKVLNEGYNIARMNDYFQL